MSAALPSPPPELRDEEGLWVVEATTEDERRKVLLEVLGRQWAVGHGIPTPRVVDSHPDGRWMVSERLARPDVDPPLEEALDLATRIATAPTPRFTVTPSSWRAAPLTRPWRAARMVALGIDPLHFRRVRAAAFAVPQDHTSHGDFHHRNVVPTPTGSQVIDFEHLGPGNRHADVLRLLSTYPSEVAIPRVEAMLAAAGPSERREVAATFRWMALRNLSGHAVPRSVRRIREDVPLLRQRLQDAEALTRPVLEGA